MSRCATQTLVAARPSTSLGEVKPSYRPGVTPTDLSSCLPDYAIAAIREALPAFGRQIKGFDRADAVLSWMLTNMYEGDGRFFFQKHKLFTNRISYMRWSQAWMFRALTAFDEHSVLRQCASGAPH